MAVILAVFMCVIGCGSGGGGNSGAVVSNVGGSGGSNGDVFRGIWTGTLTSNALAGPAPVELELFSNGTTLTGTDRITVEHDWLIGVDTGTITSTTNTSATANVSLDYGKIGVWTGTATATNSTMTGSVSIPALGGVSATATFSLTKSGATGDAMVAGTYTGLRLDTVAGATPKAIAFTISQSNQMLSLVDTITNNGSIPGTIIGNTITFSQDTPGGTDETYFTGRFEGSSITGTCYKPGGNSVNGALAVTGTFTMTKL